MALASGADIKIGTREFMLTADEDSYLHIKESMFSETNQVIGSRGKQSTDSNLLFWGYDNWIGGEGLDFYDEEKPNQWWFSIANTRKPGVIESTPTRAQATTITTGVTPTFGGFVAVAGRLWYFTGDQGYYSSDSGATWTENTDVAVELPVSYQITSVCSDGEFPYFAASDGTNRGIWRCDSTTVATDVVTAHASTAPYKGLAVRDGFLYAWTGGALLRYKLDQIGGSLPITHTATAHRKYRINNEAPTGTIYADLDANETSTIMMRSYDGTTQFHEYKLDPQTNKQGGRKFWTVADGFTGRQFCVHAGVLFVAGDYQDRTALWGYSLTNKAPFFLGYVGEPQTIKTNGVRWIAPSYGAQIMMGLTDGTNEYVYVYDAEEDAFSVLDYRTIAADGVMLAGTTFRAKRLSAHFATTSTKINRWNLDNATPATTFGWRSPAFDMNFPQDEKVLLGIHVVQDPAIAAGQVTAAFELDEDGTEINTDSAGATMTTAAGSKHTYFTISGSSVTRKFRTLRLGLAGIAGCRVFSVTARAYTNTRRESWRLKLKLADESQTSRHPSNRTVDGETLRDYLHTLVDAGDVVTFLDGRRYKEKSGTTNVGYTTHTCMITFPKDYIDTRSEGTCEVILRSVAPSA